MKKKNTYYLIAIIGIVLLGVGLSLLKLVLQPQGILMTLPYICIGFGSGLFGHGVGELVNHKAEKRNPLLQRQMEISRKDERNISIVNHAKAKAYDMMIYVFGALMVSFTLMGVDVFIVLLLIFAYLVVVGFHIYYVNKYNKEM